MYVFHLTHLNNCLLYKYMRDCVMVYFNSLYPPFNNIWSIPGRSFAYFELHHRTVTCWSFWKHHIMFHVSSSASTSQPVLLYNCAVWEVVNTVIPNPDEGRLAGCFQLWSLHGILRDQSWATVTWLTGLTPNTCGKDQNIASQLAGVQYEDRSILFLLDVYRCIVRPEYKMKIIQRYCL